MQFIIAARLGADHLAANMRLAFRICLIAIILKIPQEWEQQQSHWMEQLGQVVYSMERQKKNCGATQEVGGGSVELVSKRICHYPQVSHGTTCLSH